MDREISGCNGILAYPHKGLAAFTTHFPEDRIFDMMEIPPFGSLGESDYTGLRPDRIDCVLVSYSAKIIYPLRMPNYIQPYVSLLESSGGRTLEIPNFGTLTKAGGLR